MIAVNKYHKVGNTYVDSGEEYTLLSIDSILFARPINAEQSDVFIVYLTSGLFITDLLGVDSFGPELIEVNEYTKITGILKDTGLPIRVYAKNVANVYPLEPGYATDGITPVDCAKVRLSNGRLIITDDAGRTDFLEVLGPGIVHESRTISTTSPLSGGGNLTANRTLSIPKSTALTDGYLSATDWTSFNDKVKTSRKISTTAPLTGGGDLTSDRTLSMAAATTSVDGYLSATDWTSFNSRVPYTTATTGVNIAFVAPQMYNTRTSPATSNITNDLTGARIGIVQKIYHNHTIAPSFPAGWVLVGEGFYIPTVLNIIYAEWVEGTTVEYWITQ